VLTESRKFGVRAVVATQYPDRLAPEVRAAAAGASAHFVTFRVPPASAAEAGSWLGLDASVAQRLLPTLPPGRGIELDPESGALRSLGAPAEGAVSRETLWSEALARTRTEFGASAPAPAAPGGDSAAVERLLLALLAAHEERRSVDPPGLIRAAASLPGAPVAPGALEAAWPAALRQGWVELRDGHGVLTSAGERWLGLGAPTLATRETTEHRRLVMDAFRIFARRGYRIEIVRQGRFDTTLPDAVFRQLAARSSANPPSEIAAEIDRARTGWAWRFFGGRDVHLEAEVSGALRAERIRHGCGKAAGRGAYVLFLVGDAHRARRVRSVLERERWGRDRAQVWTLSPRGPPKS
jgi:hypothetical protein